MHISRCVHANVKSLFKFIALILVLQIIAFLHSETVISSSIDAVPLSVEKTSHVEQPSEQVAVS
jgi:hypothetical protein